jgi:hypothetical protein
MAFRNHFTVAVALGVSLISTPSFCQIITSDSTAIQPAVTQSVVDTVSSGIKETQAVEPAAEVQQSAVQPAPVKGPSNVAQDSTESSEIEKPVSTKKTHLIGFGADLGFQLFGPAQVNDYLDLVYTRMKRGYYIINEAGSPLMFLGFNFGGHFMLRPIPWLAVGGIGRYFTTTKRLKISTTSSSLSSALSDPDFTVNVSDGIVGGKIEGFVNPSKTVTLKGGVNIERHFASVELEQINTVKLSGRGIGCTPFLGLSIAPGRGLALISVDFMAPICKIKLNKVKGMFNLEEDNYAYSSDETYSNNLIPYPKELNLTGFMIKPSITICFP